MYLENLHRQLYREEAAGFTAFCAGALSWSLAKLYDPNALRPNNSLALLSEQLKAFGVERAYAPNVSAFNARFIEAGDFTSAAACDSVCHWHCAAYPAEGMLLFEKDAFLIEAAGCPVLIIKHDDSVAVAHAGRDSLFDRCALLGGSAREHESVCFAALSAACGEINSARASQAHAWIYFSIPPLHFRHPLAAGAHASDNEKMYRYLAQKYGACGAVVDGALELDLPFLIARQLRSCGMDEKNIHLSHAYLAPEMPHTRDGQGKRRSLVIVARH